MVSACMSGTRGSGVMSNTGDVLEMSVVRGVGGVCDMCMCLARGGVGGEGGEWMRELGLGFTNPVGTGGVLDVLSDHEEADTRLLLHVHQAARVFSSVTIKSPDTDVMVLSLAKSQDFHVCLLLFMTRSSSNNRIINITELEIKLGQEKCQASLGLHIFTGCNNISAFKGKGKTNPFGLMLESEAFCSAFIALRCG